MSVTIKYDNYDFPSQPTPFISRSENFIKQGEQWGTSEELTLEGTLTGCTMDDLIEAQRLLISGFSQDFQSLEIIEDSETILQKQFVKVDSVSFPSQIYRGKLDYSISLSCFPQDLFLGQYGVQNPVDSWEYSTEDNGVLNITHTVSCKGFTTSSTHNNALQNAKDFVLDRTGFSSAVLPHFTCPTPASFSPCLLEYSENINRIDGSYSVTETYVTDPTQTGYGVLRYSVDIASGVGSFNTATVNGEIVGCKNSFDRVRDRYRETDFFSKALDVYIPSLGVSDLNPSPVSSGIEEDPYGGSLSFRIDYDNDKAPDIQLDYSTTLNYTPELTSVSINGNITARGDIPTRNARVSGKLQELDVFGLAYTAYDEFYESSVKPPFNPVPLTSGASFYEKRGEASFHATFDNREIHPSGIESMDVNMSFVPALQRVHHVALFDQNGKYDVVDLGFKNRATFGIDIRATKNQQADPLVVESGLRNYVNILMHQYAGAGNNIKLESYNFTTGSRNTFDINAEWSIDSPNNVLDVDSGNYSEISTLRITFIN